jgi:hypothetical protein
VAWKHQLFTEEEVFGYNIPKKWSFPDHLLNDYVIFEVDSPEFILDLLGYLGNWGYWVQTPVLLDIRRRLLIAVPPKDCVMTQKSPEDTLLLLETIPGLRIRARLKN